MTYQHFERFGDIAFAEKFEGINQKVNWTDTQWSELETMLDSNLLDVLNKQARSLYITQQLRGPLADIKSLIEGKSPSVKYRLYSAHDDNIANMLVQLNPTFKWLGIRYASNIKFEVYERSDSSFMIYVIYNGKPLQLEKCAMIFCTA